MPGHGTGLPPANLLPLKPSPMPPPPPATSPLKGLNQVTDWRGKFVTSVSPAISLVKKTTKTVTPRPVPGILSLASGQTAANLLAAGVPDISIEAVEYYHLDALGSVRAVTDNSGMLVRTHDYKPFGEELTLQADDQLLFTGKQRDFETGLDLFGAPNDLNIVRDRVSEVRSRWPAGPWCGATW